MNIDKIADAIHRAKRDCDNNVALDYRCLAQAAVDAMELRERIAVGIQQTCSDMDAEYSYHEPHRDIRILDRLHAEAHSIADYILG